jgi:type IV secretory pathway TrbD component
MLDTRHYSRQVHRSLLQRPLLGGIPEIGLLILVILAVVFCFGFSMYFMIAPIIVLYILMRILTSKDPWLIDIIQENLTQKDTYLP